MSAQTSQELGRTYQKVPHFRIAIPYGLLVFPFVGMTGFAVRSLYILVDNELNKLICRTCHRGVLATLRTSSSVVAILLFVGVLLFFALQICNIYANKSFKIKDSVVVKTTLPAKKVGGVNESVQADLNGSQGFP